LFRLAGQHLEPDVPVTFAFLGYDITAALVGPETVAAWVPIGSSANPENFYLVYRYTLRDGHVLPTRLVSGYQLDPWTLPPREDHAWSAVVVPEGSPLVGARADPRASLWSKPPDVDRAAFDRMPPTMDPASMPFALEDAVDWAGECPGPDPHGGCSAVVQEYLRGHPEAFVTRAVYTEDRLPTQDPEPAALAYPVTRRWALNFTDPEASSSLEFQVLWHLGAQGVTDQRPVYEVVQVRLIEPVTSTVSPTKPQMVPLDWVWSQCAQRLEPGFGVGYREYYGMDGSLYIGGRPAFGVAGYLCADGAGNQMAWDAFTGFRVGSNVA
jgi:hypothetical protein